MHFLYHRLILLSPYLVLLLVFLSFALHVSAQFSDTSWKNQLSSQKIKPVSLDSMFGRPDPPIHFTGIKKIQTPVSDSLSDALYRKYFPGKPAVKFEGGYVNYNFFYRSNLDTPFIQNGVDQNLVNAAANVLIADKYPVRVSVALRRSNSFYFRDYTYVNVELNTAEMRRMQSDKLRAYFNDMTGQLMNPGLKQWMTALENRTKNLTGLLNRPDIVKEFLQSKETIIHQEDLSGTEEQKDSVVKRAKKVIELYEHGQQEIKDAEKSYDSLKRTYAKVNSQIQDLRQVFNKNISSPDGSGEISRALHEANISDPHFDQLTESLFAIRTLAVGQTMPNYTPLTVQNIGVNGLNVEYNKNHLYAAFVGGLVNFEAMNFVMTGGSPSKQYVAAGRIGWGTKEGDHLIYTLYDGKKQLFSSLTSNNTTDVLGMSVEGQWMLTKNIRLTAEMAQSVVEPTPYIRTDTVKKKFALSDKTNQAWSLQMHAYFPATKTGLEGFYEFQGINFQCFNAYKVNANTDAFNIKGDQYLFSNQVHIAAAVQKNNYINPLVLQNYNSNTVFVTTTASFHRPGWPMLTVGYIPSSQYSIINNQTYESRFQAFNVNLNHSYKIGSARAITTVMFNRFYNSLHDSGFVYYNADNFYASQNFIFTAYSANISVSHTGNPQYSLDVMEGGFSKTIKRTSSIGFGLKLNHLNTNENKLGYYINGRAVIKEIGTINVSAEKSFLPGIGNVLINSDFVNIGFIRYFK